jgi:hypothetical protein
MSINRMGRPVLFLAFAGVFLLSPLTFAQNTDSLPSIEKKRPNSLKPGAWALQFQIIDNFRSFSGLQGFGVSVKYHFSRTNALRLGVGGSLSNSDSDADGRSFQADTVRQKTIGGNEGDTKGVDFAAQYVIYVAPLADVTFFFGSGPLVHFSQSVYDQEDGFSYGTTTGTRSYWTDDDRWTIGLSALSGAEWFATKSISLHAEYDLSLEYQSTKRVSKGIESSYDSYYGARTYSYESESSGHSTRFNLATVKFGLSVYF